MEEQTDALPPVGESVSISPEPPLIPPELVDPDGVMGQPYVFPGFQGKPFRGPVPDLKKGDPTQPKVGMEGHAFIFDLSNPKHLAYYEKIFHMAYNGRAAVGVDRVDYDSKTGTYRAFVRWAFLFTHMKTQTGGPRG